VWRGIYDGLDMVVFVIVASILGLGGLEQEREVGSAGFTLALPVTRTQLLWPRVAAAMLEMAALAAIPLVVVPWVSASIGHGYPIVHAARFAMLFAITGTLWVSASVFVSVAVSGSYASIVASVLVPAICSVVFAGPALRHYPAVNPFNVMNGQRLGVLDPVTALVVGPLPWTALACCVVISASLLASAAIVASRRGY
jgi:ABC-type transport system involved in multi-copper enzyme maturation permease subunit